MGLKSLSPADFGARHRALFEQVVGAEAEKHGKKTLSRALRLELAYAPKQGTDLGIVYDNVQAVGEETGDKAIKLADAYAKDEELAIAAATQAAKTTGGVLTPKSARFLPEAFRADYERLTGLKIDAGKGTAVDGVSFKKAGSKTTMEIDFKKALSGATAREVVLAVTDDFVVSATRRDGTMKNPDLPPYWLVLSPRAGRIASDSWLVDENGMRGFSDPDSGQLLHAGEETVKLTDQSGDKVRQTWTFKITGDNDDADVQVNPPTQKTKALRDAWGGYFKEDEAQFDFDAALASGKLVEKTLAEVRDVPGIKTLFSAIRDNTDTAISKLVKNELLHFYEDPKTNSLAVLRSFDGESGGYLSLIDHDRKKWVGGYAFGDDGTIDFNER